MKKKKLRLVKRPPAPKASTGKSRGKKPSSFANKLLGAFKVLAIFTLVGGALTLAVGGTLKYYNGQKLFILKEVEVTGNSQINRETVLEYLQLEFGVKLIDIPVREHETLLEKHPWVEEASVSRWLPAKLKIKLKEKQPLALFYFESETKTEWYGLSADGKMLPGISLHQFNLPILDKSQRLDSAQLGKLVNLLSLSKEKYPEIFNSISQIKHRGENDFIMLSRDNRYQYLVSTDLDPTELLEFWELLVRRHGREFASGQTIDLRIKGNAYVS